MTAAVAPTAVNTVLIARSTADGGGSSAASADAASAAASTAHAGCCCVASCFCFAAHAAAAADADADDDDATHRRSGTCVIDFRGPPVKEGRDACAQLLMDRAPPTRESAVERPFLSACVVVAMATAMGQDEVEMRLGMGTRGKGGRRGAAFAQPLIASF